MIPFKAANGSAGTGKAWHHIVEQNQIVNSGFNSKMGHHVDNLVAIETGAGTWHSRITADYATHGKFAEIPANMSLRNWLKGKPFEVHYEWGLRVMKEMQ
jgi:hypothetical protein